MIVLNEMLGSCAAAAGTHTHTGTDTATHTRTRTRPVSDGGARRERERRICHGEIHIFVFFAGCFAGNGKMAMCGRDVFVLHVRACNVIVLQGL
jgi:hypothetical protein